MDFHRERSDFGAYLLEGEGLACLFEKRVGYTASHILTLFYNIEN